MLHKVKSVGNGSHLLKHRRTEAKVYVLNFPCAVVVDSL